MSTFLDDAKVVYHPTFDGRGFTNENSLAHALLSKPDQIDPVITHLLGKQSKMFPLSFLTEGQYGGSVPVNNVQYHWDVINKLNKVDYVVSSTYTTGDRPGLGGRIPFYFTTKTNWLKMHHLIESQNGTVARVDEKPTRNGLYWTYRATLWTTDPNAFVPLADLQPGVKWGMVGGAPVAESRSSGNESNVVSPGKVKNQLTFLRKSYRFGGNISNKTVECQFTLNGNQKTNLWMNWEQWQHMLQWKQAVEENCWYSKYNRNRDGVITQLDPITGEPIPTGAGLLEQIPHVDTYSFLTAKKIKSIVRDVLFGATDGQNRNIVLYTGTGGREDFDTAMKQEALATGFTQVKGDKFIRGEGRNLILGGYFTTYEHIDGHTITLAHLPLLDEGGRALVARKHPISKLPITSHHMYFVDQSVYDGKRNVQMAHQKGRSMVTGVLRGMSPVPPSLGWSGNNMNINLATEIDKCETHFMCSKSIFVRRNSHCFRLECTLS